MTTRLCINRLSIFKGAALLYSQSFHQGVNIIHGDNGSGKSTIMDFIFYVLGGDLKEWKPHAELADFAMAEITAGESTLTLRRDVSRDAGRPMQIFFGPYDQAMNAGPTEWRLCPYKRQSDNHSFSQVLFRAIGLPEAISDGASNITMHQILRLLYSDQMTPIQRIFRMEMFDTWQTRQAVGDLLCGVGGYDIYDKQITLREVSRSFDEASAKLRNLISIAAGYGDAILADQIEVALRNAFAERDRLNLELSALLVEEGAASALDDEVTKVQKKQVRDITRARRTVAELEDRISTLEYEIDDANLFIDHLVKTLDEFDDAANTFFSLGQVRFEFCPACFAPVDDTGKHGECHLCGAPAAAIPTEPKSLAVRLDIEMQLKESRVLLSDREEALNQLRAKLRSELQNLRKVSDAYELARRGHATEREKIVSELSRQAGYLESEIKNLQDRLTLAAEITKLSAEKERLNGIITKLKEEIDAIQIVQRKRKMVAYTAVSQNAKRALDRDLKEHSDFGEVDHVSFSFSDDWMAINDDKNRSRSASGMVVLKNSFLFGLYIAALEDGAFGLPRFMLLDNIEDKGMVPERVWNIQRVLVDECQNRAVPQQLIFTTSRLAADLDKPEYLVGRKYTHDNPSLEFQKGQPASSPGS